MILNSATKSLIARRGFIIKYNLFVLFVLAFTLRIIFLLTSISQIGLDGISRASPDGVLYINMAEDIINGTNDYENGFFSFGPGFAYLLAAVFAVGGKGLFPFLILQIIISSLSCVLIYRLAVLLTRSYSVATVAGILSAISYTSIMQSLVVLSDISFFFIFLLSLILYIKGFDTGRWRYFIGAGLLAGIAILFRSVGQFWPFMMIILVYPLIRFGTRLPSFATHTRRLFLKSIVAVMLAVCIVSIWVVRNVFVHELPILADAGVNGAARVTILVLERIEERPMAEIWPRLQREYMEEHRLKELTPRDSYSFFVDQIRRTVYEHPKEFAMTYIELLWQNLNEISYFHRRLLPDFNREIIALEYKIKNLWLNYVNFVLSMCGLLILLITRQYRAFAVLAGVYIYFAVFIGFGYWQGSRLFFPGQIAWSILIGIFIVNSFNLLKCGIRRLLIHETRAIQTWQ
jgi:4-amino-4-deoxy-L-arabinose transferase-like glycosyltransferase